MLGWISVSQEMGKEIPTPMGDEDYSGRILVRSPKSLHAQLVASADREGVSLNQLVTSLLASGVGWRQGTGPVRR